MTSNLTGSTVTPSGPPQAYTVDLGATNPNAGDTITCTSEVTSIRTSDTRPTHGVVSWRTEARNQRGELVVDFIRTNLIVKRGDSD